MLIHLNRFAGRFPRLLPRNLPGNAAQTATNCDFSRGDLTGRWGDSTVSGVSVPSGTKAMFVYADNAWTTPTHELFTWTDKRADAVKSPVSNDKYKRFYWVSQNDTTGDINVWVSTNVTNNNGATPAANNKWWAGVPYPGYPAQSPTSYAPAIASAQKLGMYNVASFVVSLCCEKMDGSFVNTVALDTWNGTAWATHNSDGTITSLENGISRRRIQFNSSLFSGFSCPASSSLVSVGKVVITEATSGVYGEGVPQYTEGTPADERVLYATSASTTLTGRVMYFMARDSADATAIGSSASKTYVDGGATRSAITWYRLGTSLWYSATSGAAEPSTAAEATSVTVNRGKAVKIDFTLTSGDECAAILREGFANSEWPGEVGGFTGSAWINGSGHLVVKFMQHPLQLDHRAYVYTYVNGWGEEGPPSLPFELDAVDGQEIKLDLKVPASGHSFKPIVAVRLYRTATGSAGTTYQFVGEAAVTEAGSVGTYTFSDVKKTSELGEVLSTNNYYPPQDWKDNDHYQGMKSIQAVSNGCMVGHRDHHVTLCEPYLPYACNPSNNVPFPTPVMGIQAVEGGLLVTTEAEPYFIPTSSPDATQAIKLSIPHAGVSRKSIAAIGSTVFYASHDGIVMVTGLTGSLEASHRFFRRDKWQSLYGAYLSKMRFAAHDNFLLVWFEDAAAPGFMIMLHGEEVNMIDLDEAWNAAYVSLADDALYFYTTGTAVKQFAGFGGGGVVANRKAFTWWSKNFLTPKPVNFGAFMLVGLGQVTVTVYADDAVKHTETFTMAIGDRTPRRLPGGFLASRWSVKVEGVAGAAVEDLFLATSIEELKHA